MTAQSKTLGSPSGLLEILDEAIDSLYRYGTMTLQADPHGIDQHAPGAKLDLGKTDAGLIFESFPNALMAVAEVATFGANKYTRNGWKEVPNGLIRYQAAEARHKFARFRGEFCDPESKFSHRAHEVWNALAQLELEMTKETK